MLSSLPTVSLDGADRARARDRSSARCSTWQAGGIELRARRLAARRGGRGGGAGREVSDAPPVEARGLVKRYGEIVAVDHVDLDVERGDVFGYLGPNGAGKTTSLRMLLGLIRPTEGSARLFGRDPLDRRRAGARRRRRLRRGAALLPVPLRPAQPAAARRLRRAASSRARIEEVLELVELRDRAQGPGRRLLARDAPAARHRRLAAARSRGCCCSTSRPPASTRPACATCASSSAGSPARGSRSCSPATCSPRSRSSATASRSSARAAIVYEGGLRDLLETRGERLPPAGARARARARRRCSPSAGIGDAAPRRRRAALHRRRGRGRGADRRARPGADRVHGARARRRRRSRSCSSA